MPRRFNSFARASWYPFSRKPQPSVLWTSIAAPMIAYVRGSWSERIGAIGEIGGWRCESTTRGRRYPWLEGARSAVGFGVGTTDATDFTDGPSTSTAWYLHTTISSTT